MLFYDRARNERDAREKIENERGWVRSTNIENAKLAGEYKSFAGRSFGLASFRGHPVRNSLPNQFK